MPPWNFRRFTVFVDVPVVVPDNSEVVSSAERPSFRGSMGFLFDVLLFESDGALLR
jgi:hypothetical protein